MYRETSTITPPTFFMELFPFENLHIGKRVSSVTLLDIFMKLCTNIKNDQRICREYWTSSCSITRNPFRYFHETENKFKALSDDVQRT